MSAWEAVAWLDSFLNCRKRVCSHAENFLLSGQIALKTVNLQCIRRYSM